MYYQTLNDAKDIDKMFEAGDTTIWYLRDTNMLHDLPTEVITNDGKTITTKDVPMNAVLSKLERLGTISKDIKNQGDVEEVFMKLQGEYWSPRGQAMTMILSSGIRHTSMMPGDMIETKTHFYVIGLMNSVVIEKV